MNRFANLSIRNKLVGIILLTTVLGLACGFALVIVKSIDAFRQGLIDNTALIADVVGDYNAIYLAFDERQEATDSLRKLLSGAKTITDAYLYDAHGERFAEYSRSGRPSYPEKIWTTRHYEIRGGYVHYFVPVDFEKTSGTLYVRASTESYREKMAEFLAYMSGIVLVVVVITAAIAFFLQRFISVPILHLAHMTQRVSTENDYSLRVRKPGDDEIGVLYDGFNNMLGQIHKRQADLERSNRDLDQFAYVASHDLKAPLRAIATLSNWIEEDLSEKLSDEGREQLRLLRSRVQRMDGLIEGILQYSRAGRLDSHGERTDVAEMLRELIDLIDPPQGVEIVIGKGMPTMVTKRLRLEQVFSNLINNAIKYHHRDNGRVEISVESKGAFFEFAVRDDGPGIAPEHHEKVFRMFQTLQPRDKVESTGLGLSLVKKLVEDEGGTVTLDSSVGRGSVFRFTWPAHVTGAPEDITS